MLIVTRHPALVEVLREDFNIVGEVISHATAPAVRGQKVIGVLPLHLAAEAESVTEITLNLPPELRGKELTAQEVRNHLVGLSTYRVEKIVEPKIEEPEPELDKYDGVPADTGSV